MYPRLFQLGHFSIPIYGAFTALALVAALAALLHFARALSLDANKVWNLGLIGILTTLVVARLLPAIVYFSVFRRHPFWVLGLTANRNAWILAFAVMTGAVAAILYAVAEGLPLLRVLDCIAPTAAIALVLNRLGAFLAGAGYGLPAAHGWGVIYTSPFSMFWYGTPLGEPLYPVQMYEAVASLVILGVLVWLLSRRTQDGELAGVALFLFGVAGFFLDLYCAGDRMQMVFRQTVFILMVILSAPLLLRRKSRSYTEDNDSTRP